MTHKYKLGILLIAAIVIGLISSAGAVCPECNAAGCVCTSDTEATLLAGQNEEVGLVSIDLVKDASGNDVIDVTYTTADGWLLEDAHLYVGTVPPANSAPGSFPYKVEDLGGVTEYTFQVPYPTGYADPCGPQNDGSVVQDAFYLAPHGVVSKNGHQESTWANGTLIREKKNWAMYFGADVNVECNDCPVTINDTYEAVEDTILEVPAGTGVLSNDADEEGNPINIVSSTQPEHGSVALNADGSLAYTPNANYCGPDSFTYAVTDGICDAPVSATVNINVACVNDCPVAADDTASADEDGSVAIPVTANDQDIENDPLSVGSFANGANGVVTKNEDGTLTYTPNPDFCGTDTFTYKVTDGICAEASWDEGTVTVTVNCENDAPVAVSDAYSIDEDTPLTVDAPGVLENDVDIDGDSLSIDPVLVAPASNGVVTANADGSFTYTPVEDFCGTDSFEYTLLDDQGASDTAAVIINVACVEDNVAPDAVDDEAATDKGIPVDIPVLENDVDADGDSLTVDSVSDPASGTATNNGDGTVTYTPDEGSCSDDSFTYTVSDGKGGSDTATVAVAMNCPPDAVDDYFSVSVGETLTVYPDELLANDVDPDGDNLIILDFAYYFPTLLDSHFVVNEDGSFTFTPPDENPCHIQGAIPYAIFDDPEPYETLNFDPAHMDIAYIIIDVVCAENTVPDAASDSYVTDMNTPLTVGAPGVLENDVDIDGDSLSIDPVLVAMPSNGAVVVNADGSFTYTPTEGFCGTDSFEYTLLDGQGGSDTAEVIIDVACVEENACPVAEDDYYEATENTVLIVPPSAGVFSNDYDDDGDVLARAYYMSAQNGHVSLGYDGKLTYTPNEGFIGEDSFFYGVSDGVCTSEPATVTISVSAGDGNICPAAVEDIYQISGNTALNVLADTGVLSNDYDDDGDTIILAGHTQPISGSLTLNDDGSFTYTPGESFSLMGFDFFTYYVSDGSCTSEGTVGIMASG